MVKGHPDLPRAIACKISRQELLNQLQQIDNDQERRERVLRLENAFRRRIGSHIVSLPAEDAVFRKFNTNPYVLLIHARQREYTKISELEADILPAKQFSSMETSAGKMVEEVVLPEYGWQSVISEMHSTNSALDGKRKEQDIYRLVTLKSGPRCLNDEMSENLADAVLNNFEKWAQEGGVNRIDFTYGVLYGTKKLSNKKDWHILRNIKEKSERLGNAITLEPQKRWECQFKGNGIVVDVSVRIGLDWWNHLGGELCFIEVFTALVRACINPGPWDSDTHKYTISDLNEIVKMLGVSEEFNVSLLQRSQIPWLFLIARHFCDKLVE